LDFSSVFTALPNIPAPAWALPFANGLSNESAGESGSNPNPAGVQRFTLQPHATDAAEPTSRRKLASVLLIEDNRADVELVREALEEHGIHGELIVLSDGESAIQFVHYLDAQSGKCPDLLILDLNLPKKSGREVLECVRQSVACGSSPVLVLSSSDAPEDRADTARLGATRYIRKPSRLHEFMGLGVIFKTMLGSATH
jgi:CheY-like chemotaxis protein